MTRTRYTNAQKIKILADTDARLSNGETLTSVAKSHNVQPAQLRNWKQNRAQLSSNSSTSSATGGASTTGTGSLKKPSILKPFEVPLIRFAFEQRALGVPVTYGLLVVKARELCEEFRRHPSNQQYLTVRRLGISKQLVDPSITKTSKQERKELMIQDAKAWLTTVRPIVQAPQVQQKFVINMDQMPVLLANNSKRTLDFADAKIVYVRNTDHLTVRFTVSLAISANGDKLKPLVVFPGQPGARISTGALMEFESQDELLISSQEHAGQDQQLMGCWIDQILVPYLQEKAEGVPVILCLDEFEVNKSEETRAKLAGIGVHLQLIPAGCNALLQPVDISIRSPFKYGVQTHWITRNMDSDFNVSPSRKEVLSWIADVWRNIDSNSIRNGWRNTDFNYF